MQMIVVSANIQKVSHLMNLLLYVLLKVKAATIKLNHILNF